MQRIYPDTLDYFEENAHDSDEFWQVYSVTDGMGGPGIGDISGRLVQEMLIRDVRALQSEDPQTFNFPEFIQEWLIKADSHLRKRLEKHRDLPVGCSIALVLIAGRVAYTMSLGTNRIYLYRDSELTQLTRDHVLGDGDDEVRPLVFLGNHPGTGRLKAQNLNKIDLLPGDKFLLLSDGMFLENEKFEELFAKDESLRQTARSIYLNAQQTRSSENKSLIALEIITADGVDIVQATGEHAAVEKLEPVKTVPRIRHAREPELREPETDDDQPKSERRAPRATPWWKLFLQSFLIGISIGILLALLYWLIFF